MVSVMALRSTTAENVLATRDKTCDECSKHVDNNGRRSGRTQPNDQKTTITPQPDSKTKRSRVLTKSRLCDRLVGPPNRSQRPRPTDRFQRLIAPTNPSQQNSDTIRDGDETHASERPHKRKTAAVQEERDKRGFEIYRENTSLYNRGSDHPPIIFGYPPACKQSCRPTTHAPLRRACLQGPKKLYTRGAFSK